MQLVLHQNSKKLYLTQINLTQLHHLLQFNTKIRIAFYLSNLK